MKTSSKKIALAPEQYEALTRIALTGDLESSTKAKILLLNYSGMYIQDIAKQYNVKYLDVYNIIRKFGILGMRYIYKSVHGRKFGSKDTQPRVRKMYKKTVNMH